ncbi:MAG: WD40/YVTN/BNR-like repeat-containing protein, partial [Phycisphaerales bacterium JB038]
MRERHRCPHVATVAVPLVGLLLGLSVSSAAGQMFGVSRKAEARQLQPEDLNALTWRSIGPANMGGRVADIALAPGNPKVYLVGYATGGIWITRNGGTTFSPIFDDYETSSIGSLAYCDAPADWAGWSAEDRDSADSDEALAKRGKAKIIWVGTGEGNGRNSSSWGHGVYRSTDGGGSFTHLGLEATHDIPALAVHPEDPDTCYIAALGHLWGANEERGVYKTSDGGETWDRVLYIDERTGACDVLIDPQNPERLFAAMYARKRTIGSFQSGGPEGGIYRSDDAGETWQKLTEGLPSKTGRIGLALYDNDPSIVYAVVESDEDGWFAKTWSNFHRKGGVFRSTDGGDAWSHQTNFNPRAFYYSRLRVAPDNGDRVYMLGWQLYVSDDGGESFRAGLASKPHVDFHAMRINPDDPDHLFIGTDGGMYTSQDGGGAWHFHNNMAVGQFYNVAVDMSDPYRVGGGLQDNGSWIGPSMSPLQTEGGSEAITNAEWQNIWWGDGFHVDFDPLDPNIVYAESQGGEIGRIHLDVGKSYKIMPAVREGGQRLRFNWNAPFFVSAHEPTTLYFAGNTVYKFTDRGERWQRISPDLSHRDVDIIDAVGSEAETAGTVVSLAESPLQAGFLWAGTDDGRIHVTTNDGETWTEVTPDEVGGLYVSKIEPSHHERDTAYIAIDGHRSDVFTPILLKTTDGGASWKSIAGDLPDGAPPKVVREDLRNPEVLYVGTERAVYLTIDGGEHWTKLNAGSLPTVAVDDLKVHPREHDLVAGTHGRSVWILDDATPLS